MIIFGGCLPTPERRNERGVIFKILNVKMEICMRECGDETRFLPSGMFATANLRQGRICGDDSYCVGSRSTPVPTSRDAKNAGDGVLSSPLVPLLMGKILGYCFFDL